MTVDCRVRNENNGSGAALSAFPAAVAKFEKESDDGDPMVQCLCCEYALKRLRMVGADTPSV